MKKLRKLPLNGAAWRVLREEVLMRDPVCVMCLKRGEFRPSTQVDHIENNLTDYSDINELWNLQGLCDSCHSLKTAQDLGKHVSLGCGLDGHPVDPRHPWNR